MHVDGLFLAWSGVSTGVQVSVSSLSLVCVSKIRLGRLLGDVCVEELPCCSVI